MFLENAVVTGAKNPFSLTAIVAIKDELDC
jgi:hypothetical protein